MCHVCVCHLFHVFHVGIDKSAGHRGKCQLTMYVNTLTSTYMQIHLALMSLTNCGHLNIKVFRKKMLTFHSVWCLVKSVLKYEKSDFGKSYLKLRGCQEMLLILAGLSSTDRFKRFSKLNFFKAIPD